MSSLVKICLDTRKWCHFLEFAFTGNWNGSNKFAEFILSFNDPFQVFFLIFVKSSQFWTMGFFLGWILRKPFTESIYIQQKRALQIPCKPQAERKLQKGALSTRRNLTLTLCLYFQFRSLFFKIHNYLKLPSMLLLHTNPI